MGIATSTFATTHASSQCISWCSSNAHTAQTVVHTTRENMFLWVIVQQPKRSRSGRPKGRAVIHREAVLRVERARRSDSRAALSQNRRHMNRRIEFMRFENVSSYKEKQRQRLRFRSLFVTFERSNRLLLVTLAGVREILPKQTKQHFPHERSFP